MMTRDHIAEQLVRTAVGPCVRLRLETCAGAAREGHATLVMWALDAETHDAYNALGTGLDGRGGADRDVADRFLFASAARRLDGVDASGEIERYGSLAGWFLHDPHAGRLAAACAFEYLEASLPTAEDMDAVREAAYLVLDQPADRNPYATTHIDDCTREIWEDRETGELVTLERISETGCDACSIERKLYAKSTAKLGSADWVDLARAMMDRSASLEQFRDDKRRVSAREWMYVQIVRSELEKREAYLNWDASQNAKGGA